MECAGVCQYFTQPAKVSWSCGRRTKWPNAIYHCVSSFAVMIDYETFSRIHGCYDRQGLTIAQIARALRLDPKTVATWVARPRFELRRNRPRGGVLDPFKQRVTWFLDTSPYNAQQIFKHLREEGYCGGATILRDYIRVIANLQPRSLCEEWHSARLWILLKPFMLLSGQTLGLKLRSTPAL
jgi:hypothetical protein